ncbi:hypothetical protein F4814DRAFT_457960 [Daldinia grandis]|nr:hypothetical protein F4814DRAFT_457960 [Daldinia grandis]
MSSSSGNVPVNPHDHGINLWTLGLSWTLTPISIMAVCARFYIRKILANRWESHDWLMLMALAVQIFHQVGLTIMCLWGSGKALKDLTALQATMVKKWSWIIAPAVHIIAVLARISIAILLVRLFGRKIWFKRYLIIFTTVQTLVGLVVIIVTLAQCQPYELYWNPSVPGTRWDFRIYDWTATASILLYCFSDITFVLFPILIISKLNMDKRRKIGLSILIAVSLLTVAAAIAKLTIALIQITGAAASLGPEWQYIDGIINLATCVEQNLVIIMGCVPTLNSITKLTLPSFNDIRNSLASIVARIKAKSSSPGNLSPPHIYQNLELTPNFRTSDMVLLRSRVHPWDLVAESVLDEDETSGTSDVSNTCSP